MKNQEKETIVAKIQKLLALSRSNNPNEAAAALSKAQTLLQEQNLSMLDVEVKNGKRSDRYALFHADLGSRDEWRRELLTVIARNNFCDMSYRTGRSIVTLIGEKENVEAVQAMYGYVVNQLEQLAEKALKVYRASGGRVHTRSWKVSFFLRARQVIQQRLRDEKATFEAAANQNRALIVVKDADLREAKAQLLPNLKISSTRYTLRSPGGYQQGQQAGREVKFRREIEE